MTEEQNYKLIVSILVGSFNHRFKKADIISFDEYKADIIEWGTMPPWSYIYKKYFKDIYESQKPIMKKFAWTIFYKPFILGGNVNQPTGAYVEVKEIREISGFNFFSFETPSGATRVCEESSGGIVAVDFDELLENIKDSSNEELQQQIKDGAKSKHEISIIDTEDFLRYMR